MQFVRNLFSHVTNTGFESCNTKKYEITYYFIEHNIYTKIRNAGTYVAISQQVIQQRRKLKSCMITDPPRTVAQLTSSGKVNRCISCNFQNLKSIAIPLARGIKILKFLSTLSKYVSNSGSSAI